MSPEDKHSPHHPIRLVLDQKKIEESSIAVRELVEVEYGGTVWGPIWRNHLKTHLEVFKELSLSMRIRDVESEMEWVPINQHSFFQKRLQEPMPAIPSDDVGNLFYLIQGGQKVGPFTKDQVLERINKLELVMTDSISVDMGKTWIKVYQIEEFDRRLNEELGKDGNVEVLYNDLRNNNVAGLRVLQNLSQYEPTNPNYDLASTQIEAAKRVSSRDESSAGSGQAKWFALFVVAFFGIISILRLWNTSPSSTKRGPASVKEAKSRAAKRIETSRVKKSKDNTKRARAVKASTQRKPASVANDQTQRKRVRNNGNRNRERLRKLNRSRSRTNKPISKSAAFRSTRKGRRPANDDSEDDYYDDGTTPDEQDPVRSQVSKETMDPESEYDEKDEDEEQQEEPYYSPSTKRRKK